MSTSLWWPILRGLAILLLAIASLLAVQHQAEHFGKASNCPVCVQGPLGAVGLPSTGTSLQLIDDLSLLSPSTIDAFPQPRFLGPSTSRAPPAANA